MPLNIPKPSTASATAIRRRWSTRSPSTSRASGIVAVKNVTVNEDFFQGHFPGDAADAGRAHDRDAGPGRDRCSCVHESNRQSAGRALPARRRQRQVPAARSCRAIGCGSRSRSARGARTLARAHGVAYIGDAIVAEAELVMGLMPNAVAGDRPGVTIRSDRDRPLRRAASAPARSIGPYAIIGEHVRIGRDCRIGASCVDRRLDRDRRRQRDLPVRLDRADPAGPEVRRRADPAGDRRPQRDPRVRDHPPRHRGRRRADRDRRPQRVHGLRARRARLPRRQRRRSSATPPRSAGTSTVEDFATISAFSGVHQFCRVGKHAFIGGYSVVTKDALPFAKTVGNRARIYGLNTIGLDAPRSSRRTRSPSCAAPSATCCTRTPAARSRRSSATRRCTVPKCSTWSISSARRGAASAFAGRAAASKKWWTSSDYGQSATPDDCVTRTSSGRCQVRRSLASCRRRGRGRVMMTAPDDADARRRCR